MGYRIIEPTFEKGRKMGYFFEKVEKWGATYSEKNNRNENEFRSRFRKKKKKYEQNLDYYYFSLFYCINSFCILHRKYFDHRWSIYKLYLQEISRRTIPV